MSKIAIAVGVSMAVLATSAQAATEFFVGAEAGYQNIDMQESFGYSDEFSQSGSSIDFSMSGMSAGLFAGMKFAVTDSFYLAPEVNFGTSNASGGRGYSNAYTVPGMASSNNYSYEYEAGKSYGFGVLAGFLVTEATSVYGRLGYQKTNFELTESYNDQFMMNGAMQSVSDSYSEDRKFGGIRYGVGIETALTPEMALRLDWSQTDYSSESVTNAYNETTTFDPTESQFQVGISYRF